MQDNIFAGSSKQTTCLSALNELLISQYRKYNQIKILSVWMTKYLTQ